MRSQQAVYLPQQAATQYMCFYCNTCGYSWCEYRMPGLLPSCPNCGSTNVSLTYAPAQTGLDISAIMNLILIMVVMIMMMQMMKGVATAY